MTKADGPRPAVSRLLILALFGGMAAIRLFHLRADPPANLDWSGGVFFDEGMLAHGARNRALFGHTNVDDWNDFFISPILAYVKWWVFALLGVGIAQVRLIPVAFSMGILVLTYFSARRACGWRAAVLTVTLLGFSYLFVMFNRIGLTETSALFFMSAAGFLWGEGVARLPRGPGTTGHAARPIPLTAAAYLTLAGASTFLAYVFKSYPSFLLVPSLALLATTVTWRSTPSPCVPRHARQAHAAIALGFLAVLLPWYALFYRRHADAIHHAMRFYEKQSLPRDLHQAIENICDLSFFRTFFRDPVLLYFSFGYLGVLIYAFFHDREKLDPYDLFAGLWFSAHFAFDALLNYTPVRYHVPAIPPMCTLVACAMVRGSRRETIATPRQLRLASLPFLWIWLAMLIGHLPLLLDRTWLLLAGATVPSPSNAEKMLASFGVAGLVIGVAALLVRTRGRREWHLPHALGLLAFVALPLGYTLAVQARDYASWALHPSYRVRDISRQLAAKPGTAWIAGLAAPELCFETQHHPLHVFENFFNDKDLFSRYPVTHLLLDGRQREQHFYYEHYPEQMRDAVLLDSFPIAYTNLFLLSVVEPTVRPIALDAAGTSGFSARLRVHEPERGQERPVRVGWALVREIAPGDPAVPPITGEIGGDAPLPPGGSQEIEIGGPAPPGPYRLLSFVLPAHRAVFDGRFFDHESGKLVDDPEADGGLAWKTGVALGRNPYMAFGPYLRFGPGRFHVTFRLRAGPQQHHGVLARIEIARAMGHGVLASRALTADELPPDGHYHEASLDYLHDQEEGLEFRVMTFCTAELWLDDIVAEIAPGSWADHSITIPATGSEPATIASDTTPPP